ncbi:MAG: hypothetical protein M3R71_02860, partial [Actinomycetota bacterium]|nr:hypothetical protein [Actinomycetota bacterium]
MDVAAATRLPDGWSRPVALAGDRLLELSDALAPLFSDRGLRRGSTVAVETGQVPGSTLLSLALLAGPSRAGSWAGVVGFPALGLVAAAQAGITLQRLALIPDPGAQWPVVVAALVDSLDVVLLRLPARTAPGDARRLTARARERGAVLV